MIANERRNVFINIGMIVVTFIVALVAFRIDQKSWLVSSASALILIVMGILLSAFFIGLKGKREMSGKLQGLRALVIAFIILSVSLHFIFHQAWLPSLIMAAVIDAAGLLLWFIKE